MTENGDLIVLNVDKYAAGNYTCRATNMAGSRDTPPAIVWVYGKFRTVPTCGILMALFDIKLPVGLIQDIISYWYEN